MYDFSQRNLPVGGLTLPGGYTLKGGDGGVVIEYKGTVILSLTQAGVMSLAGTAAPSGFTPTRVAFADAGGLLTDDGGMVYNAATNTLTVDAIVAALTGAVTGNVIGNVTGTLIGDVVTAALSTAFRFKIATGTFTAVNAQTATGSTQIPAGAYVFGVTTRVVTTFDGDASTHAILGTAADDDAWGASLVLTATTLGVPSQWTALPFAALNYFAGATNLTLDGTAGKVLGDPTPVGLMNYAIYYVTIATPAAA